MRIRSGPATVSAEERSEYATGASALGRQLRSGEARARRPAEFTSIRIGLEGKVDSDSGSRPNYPYGIACLLCVPLGGRSGPNPFAWASAGIHFSGIAWLYFPGGLIPGSEGSFQCLVDAEPTCNSLA